MPSCIKAVEHAWNKMILVLFSPFEIGKWFLLGLSAWLAHLMEDGGGFEIINQLGSMPNMFSGADWRVNLNKLCPERPESLSDLVNLFNSLLLQHTGLGFTFWGSLVGVILLFMVALTLLLLWLKTRCEFIFLDNTVNNTSHFVETWSQFKSPGNSLFLWRVGFGFFAFLLWGLLLLGLVVLLIATCNDNILFLSILAGAIAILVPGAILFALVESSLRHFVVPLMYKKSIKVIAAWGEFLKILRTDATAFIRFFLMLALLRIAGAFILSFAAIATCCCCGIGIVFYIPYISAVVVLPFSVFFRLYGVEFLSQFGGEYDLRALPMERPQATGSV